IAVLVLQAGEHAHLVASGQARPDGPHVPTVGQLVISEFRLRGPNGPNDEFIEIYNQSGSDHTVAAASGTRDGVVASDGLTRCSIPNGTVIPNRGHYLCVNSVGYSLTSYPAGSGTTATGDATYTTDIPDNTGIALFNNNAGGVDYSLANRLDAVGPTSEANTLFREGAGYAVVTPLDINYSFARRLSGGCTGSGGGAGGTRNSVLLMQTTSPAGQPMPFDSNNNSTDFIFVDTSATNAGAGQRLGAPGPENLSSPIARDGGGALASARLDTCVATLAMPNKVRDFTSDPVDNSTFGTYDIRRTWKNNTGLSLTRLRFRIVDISTFPSIAGVADLRARTSADTTVIVDRPPCGSGTSSVLVKGTTLETPPTQGFAGGFNATLSVGAVTPGTPLATGASIDVRFLLGIQQTGIGRFCVFPETLPSVSIETFCFIGNTDVDITARAGDYDFDQRSDIPLFNPTLTSYRVLRSIGGGFVSSIGIQFSVPLGFTAAPGDYDGDGRFDFTFYDPSAGVWYFLLSGSGYQGVSINIWGGPGYQPVPGDYDGDGVTDIAVYNATSSSWYILTSSTAFTSSLVIS